MGRINDITVEIIPPRCIPIVKFRKVNESFTNQQRIMNQRRCNEDTFFLKKIFLVRDKINIR